MSGSAIRQDLGVIHALWVRDLLRLRKERSRWFGVVLQPVIFWLILGSGMAGTFSLRDSDLDYTAFFYPGVLVMIVLFTSLFATISVIEDRQSGFLQGVLVAPGSRVAMVLGKVAGVASLTGIQLVLFLALAPMAGYGLLAVNWPLLLVVVLLSSASLTAIHLAAAWVSPSVAAYHAIMSILTLPLWVLSGAMFPVPDGWMGALMRANPMTYMVAGVRDALGAQAGLGLPATGLTLGLLAVFALAGVGLATRVCRR